MVHECEGGRGPHISECIMCMGASTLSVGPFPINLQVCLPCIQETQDGRDWLAALAMWLP